MGFTATATTRFANKCTGLNSRTTNSGTGPATSNAGGYHNSRNRLQAIGKGNDYSLRYPWDQNGNGECWCAFDWGMPDQATISLYMRRVRDAYYRKDPRLLGWREVLGAIDGVLIAFNCAPNDWYTRVPDSSHYTHIHFSVLREFVEEDWVYDAMFSILRGDTLEQWQGNGGWNMDANQEKDLLRRVWNIDEGYLNGVINGTDTVDFFDGAGNKKTIPNKPIVLLKALQSSNSALSLAVQGLVAQNDALKADIELLKDMYTAPQPVAIDFDQLRAALTDPAFLGSLASAVNDDAAARMAE